jgi:hypothetical protein
MKLYSPRCMENNKERGLYAMVFWK